MLLVFNGFGWNVLLSKCVNDAVVNSDDSLFVLDGEGAPGGENDITIPVVMAGATESFRLLAQLRAVAEAAEALRMNEPDGGKLPGRTAVDCPCPFPSSCLSCGVPRCAALQSICGLCNVVT